MAKKSRSRSQGKKGTSPHVGKMVPLNPWIPAIPVKGPKGKPMLQLVLGIPLILTAGIASAELLPNRTLQVPVELTQHRLSLKQFNQQVLPRKHQLLGQYEARIFLVAKGGK